jgi:RNA-splicing ligase RtcB
MIPEKVNKQFIDAKVNLFFMKDDAKSTTVFHSTYSLDGVQQDLHIKNTKNYLVLVKQQKGQVLQKSVNRDFTEQHFDQLFIDVVEKYEDESKYVILGKENGRYKYKVRSQCTTLMLTNSVT